MGKELANAIIETEVIGTEAITDTKPPAEIVSTGEEAEVHIDQPPDPTALKAEIDRLQEVKKKAEEDARYWRKEKAQARAEYFKGSKGEEKKDLPPEDLGIGQAPRIDDFDDFNKYNDAKIQYEVTKARITWDRDQARKQVEKSQQDKMETLQGKISRGFEKYSDFEEVAMDQTVPITPMIMDVLADSDAPEDVAYYLGRNRAEAIQISRMTPTQAARAIAKIEIELAKGIKLNPPLAKKVSNAPPPINPVNTGGSAVEKDPDKMSQKEYESWRESNKARRF